jgi:hypothetical protein
MPPEPLAAATSLLSGAAHALGALDPTREHAVRHLLYETLPSTPVARPFGDVLKPMFFERTPGRLAFTMDPGHHDGDDATLATEAMQEVTGRHFGSTALGWFDANRPPGREGTEYGATFATSFDRNGPVEAMVSYGWGAGTLEALPGALYDLAAIAIQEVPGLRPAISAIRCGRTSGSQQLSFEATGPLRMADLRPLMDRIGLGHQHAGLMSAAALILGARFTLPPEAAMLTLRPTRAGCELRLDVDLEQIPDLPPHMLSLVRLQMAERPASLRALDRWMLALTPDGYENPGSFALLSILVRPDVAARVALYLRPAELDAAAAEPALAP